MPRWHVISAVCLRNFQSYFSGVIGYLFIVVFVVGGAFVAFSPRFFIDNSASLDLLTTSFPFLLLYMIPAITMAVWADEREQGTDELLFTLPASDFEILLGKYLAVVSVYTVALVFSVAHALMLYWIGEPDGLLLFNTYIGYFLAGACLLAVGMFASALTNSKTVAFILGAVLVAVPSYLSLIVATLAGSVARILSVVGIDLPDRLQNVSGPLRELTLGARLEEFSLGTLTPANVLYFVSLIVFFLYLNHVLISRRRWAGQGEQTMWLHHLARAVCLGVALLAVNSLAALSTMSFDMTAERIYTPSPTTEAALKAVDRERPVTIQAFISSDVPQDYVSIRKRLIGFLTQLDRRAGSRVEVRTIDVEPYSTAAEEADLFNITPRSVQFERDGEVVVSQVYLGAVVSSGLDEVVVPFFDKGMSVEYELTRSLRTVSEEARLKVGVLRTDARVMGGFDMATFNNSPEWRIITELKKQYSVVEVSPDEPIQADTHDVLLAVMPSSLTPPQLENFVSYVAEGHPTLVFDDPAPMFGFAGQWPLAPSQPKQAANQGPFGQGGPAEPKGDNGELTSLMNLLEISWDNSEIIFDKESSLGTRFDQVIAPELITIEKKEGVSDAFNPDSEVTNGLQQMLSFFSGTIKPRTNARVTYQRLLRSGQTGSGLEQFGELFQASFRGLSPARRPPSRVPDEYAHTIAAHITLPADDQGGRGLNVIFSADADMIADSVFNLDQEAAFDLKLDNVTFVLNAVDALAGEDDFLKLRKKRTQSRQLTLVDRASKAYLKEREVLEQKAEKDAEAKLAAIRKRFEAKIEEINADKSLDPQAKAQMLATLESTENRRLEVDEAEINRQKEEQIEEIKRESKQRVLEVRNGIRLLSILIPPIPAVLLGLFVAIYRSQKEMASVARDRLVD